MRGRGQVPAFLLPAVSGALSSLAFAPFGLTPLVLVAPIPLLWALARRRRSGVRSLFLVGWTAAFVHFLVVLHWILFLPNEEVTIPGLMVPALLFMAAYLACFFGAAGAMAAWVWRRTGIPLGLAWAVLATLAEILRAQGVLGFPWGTSAYALHAWTPVLQLLPVTGFWGLALWTALVGGLLHDALVERGRRRTFTATAAALLFVLPWAHGSWILGGAPDDAIDGPRGIRLAVLQPNTSREIKWDPAYREIVVEDLLERTIAAAESRPDLIVWPETAAPIVLLQEPVYLQRLQTTVASLGIPLLAGTLDHSIRAGVYESHNSAALFGADGRLIARYDKQQLVPFSERMPFQKQLPWLGGLNFGQSDFTPGRGPVLLETGGARIGSLICFESIFPRLARGFAAQGANLLVNVTNDFWFGDTAAPVQHAEMAIFRAVETRLPLVRCANTGISMIVDPWGRVRHRTGTFVEARIDARVLPSQGVSFYARRGEWVPIGIAGVAGAMAVAALLLSLGKREWRESSTD